MLNQEFHCSKNNSNQTNIDNLKARTVQSNCFQNYPINVDPTLSPQYLSIVWDLLFPK